MYIELHGLDFFSRPGSGSFAGPERTAQAARRRSWGGIPSEPGTLKLLPFGEDRDMGRLNGHNGQ